MERLAPHEIWREVRGSLASAPVPIRLALASEQSIERHVALDRLAAFVAAALESAAVGPTEPEIDNLPLFPTIDVTELEIRPMRHEINTIEKAPSFARWLIAQQHRDDAIGELAKQAARDPNFPRDGDARAVSTRLNALGADGSIHMALEDAELDWASL